MVDLHLHTTASDGRLTPSELVGRAASTGVQVLAVTDHDTTRATGEIRALAAAHGIEAVSGIEVTAVERGRDIHILGYFLREDDADFGAFLVEQRARRLDRVRAIGERLAALGIPVSIEPLVAAAQADTGRSLGRPEVARALVQAGWVASVSEAFERWLGQDCPAFVPREGPSCEAVIAALHRAQGLASLAHPGKTRIDDRISALCDAGLDAIEVYHSDHAPALVTRYMRMTVELGVLATGGSDFHGDPAQGRSPGSCVLPDDAWRRLVEASGDRCHPRPER